MKQMMIMTIGALALTAGFMVTASPQAAAAEAKKQLLRVGTYDSRGIVMAYYDSDYNDVSFMQRISQEKKKAEADGNLEKARQLDEQMNAYGLKKHKQVFSTAPVHEIIEHVKDQLPTVARQAGVDMIISKWESDYLAEDAEVVDVTLAIAHLFNPDPDLDEAIKNLMQTNPIPEKELERLEKEHHH